MGRADRKETMSDILEKFPRRIKGRGSLATTNPEWFDGKIRRINWREETEYDSLESARASIHSAAASQFRKMRTQRDGDDHMIIQAYKESNGAQ